MSFFPTPPAADPLHIFLPTGPINPAFMRSLLQTTLATQPLAPGATPDHQADHRRATMHALAAFRPGDAVEAMLAGQMVAANARIMGCLDLAAEPDADQAEAHRHGAQAASLMRCMQATLRGFQRHQAARRKDEDQPSERSGYWFRDASVPAPESLAPGDDPADGASLDATPRAGAFDRDNPMQREAAAPAPASRNPDGGPPRSTLRPSAVRQDPMQREESATGPDAARSSPPVPPPGAMAARQDNPVRSGGTGVPPNAARQPALQPGAERQHPMPSCNGDLPERFVTGDAVMRFASRRMDPNQTVEAAWAQAVTEAAAEEADAACL